ncbi:MAG: lysylphosphatidylglycerol synthase transmembrane domain-containing protein [Candidatus ainarchaeum sp.]|nr:lysylphosphatidylglycerol synthase transmembrane domain-containing protein [Candidatus ainarchaeum sp.]
MEKRFQLLLNLLLSIALFAVIFYLVGFDKIATVLVSAKPEFFVFALMVYFVLNLVMAYRVKIVLESIGDTLSTFEVFKSSLAGMLASDFTPARIGYFFTAFSLSARHKIPFEKTLLSIFGPQLFDFMIKVTSAAILLYLIISMAGGDILLNAIVLAVFAGAIISAALLVFYPPLLKLLAPFESLPLVPHIFNFIRRMHLHSHKVLAVKWKIAAITIVCWLIKGLEWLFLSKAVGIQLSGDLISDLLFMMVFQAALTIIQFLPIPTLAGAGASEAGFAAALLPFGVPLETAVTFGFLTRIVMIAVDSLSLPVLLDYLHHHSLESSLDKIFKLEH